MRVLAQQGVVVGEEAAGGGGIDDGALEALGAGGCLDGAPGGRAGEAAAWRSSTVSATARTVSMSISSWMPSRLRAAYPS
ncbi:MULTISPECIES: hypothetical protein [unclassified Streptomyces]|uniref:hypothetical protein n=1 Tax=Streptomyces TaxID=1883 RepID=UPI0013DA8DB1|nr:MULTISPECIES: hypothetical protein [unclassified Streptomyces]